MSFMARPYINKAHLDRDKHSSLQRTFVNYVRKKFYNIGSTSFEYIETSNRRIFDHGWVNFPLGSSLDCLYGGEALQPSLT
jgi:hypothetical protein